MKITERVKTMSVESANAAYDQEQFVEYIADKLITLRLELGDEWMHKGMGSLSGFARAFEEALDMITLSEDKD